MDVMMGRRVTLLLLLSGLVNIMGVVGRGKGGAGTGGGGNSWRGGEHDLGKYK